MKAKPANTNEDPIRDFYTSHPFPPPIENLDRAREMWADENVPRAEFHLLWPDKEYRADLDVLVAGCGTWQSAKHAICHPAARVTGIDVSVTSLEHTESLKQKYNLSNLQTRQLAIENAAELDQQFDLIICTGVLHHLADPDAGLRALRSVLKPEGAMYLMVYAPYGRAGVYMIQDYCRRLGIGTSREEIGDLMMVLKYLPQHHPLLATQGGSRDFPNGDALADAVLNPRDRSYSVPEVFEFVESNGLKLSRWYWQAPYLPQCGIIASTAHASKLAALPEREQYVEMELWRGLMPNHSFVVQHNDYDAAKVSFADERVLRYVPIRLPWTTCIMEGLPPGAAGLLLNQTHLFKDLFLLLNEQEKQMFDAIDGRRSVSEIVESVSGGGALARKFFEKLWRYDQIVFDTSQEKVSHGFHG
ncbi:MAG TPA: class I SAM-dependent methyltransferase [Pyrinomonadaceae bacterium]|nr:class I SAM-dependent methyltransferase [Pyrinomonadaceae bacterium]